MIEALGADVVKSVNDTGRFFRFLWRSVVASTGSCITPGTYPLIWNQMHVIGVRSVPVIMITGAFVLINISVVKELGPVLAAVMLAGRIGGALTAELGTMKVTEQIDAVRSMGTDPMRYLVAPRVLACLLLTPFLIIYADLLGILGGYFVSVIQLGINSRAYWSFSANGVELWDVGIGVVKGFFFGGAIAAISCYKGFNCKEGAHGVGQACTEAFVGSFISILALDFALAVIAKAIYNSFWPLKSLV
ncbi:MAG: MlaE family ABC transporter permease [Planctomycetota bacterium]|jgi:phospholipid/cholesterol/gamma-HCH transport system permease protein